MHIQYDFNSINVDIAADKNIIVFKDNSGTGKTFLFDILLSYCQDYKKQYYKYDYSRHCTIDELNNIKRKGDISNYIIVMDNADLYMDLALWKLICSMECIIFIAIQDLDSIIVNDNIDLCRVKYSSNYLTLEKVVC